MAMPQDRTLTIGCTFNGTYNSGDNSYGGTMTYRYISATPSMPGVVQSTGEIDITNAPAFDPNEFHKRVDITFVLEGGGVNAPNGTWVPASWAPDLSGDQGAMVLMDVDQNGNPSGPAHSDDVEAKWVEGSPTEIEVDDKNEDKNYYFRPGVVLQVPGYSSPYFISVDPPLVNKGSVSR
jgi:hypothetical protein